MSNDAFSGNLSRASFFEKLPHTQLRYKIDVYADVINIKSFYPVAKHDIGIKQKMSGFSDNSRHAMIEFLAKVPDVPDLFVTLTYSDDIAQDWTINLRGDFEKFRHQLEYHYPNVRAMWRIEFVPRKSGRLYSQFIPHMHLLVWLPKGTSKARKDKILQNDGQLWRNAWHKITHSTDENHLAKFGCLVERIKSRKHAYAYCSKYLAKENEEQIEAGRRWGRIGKFETPTELETYMTTREYVHFKRILNAYIKAEALRRFKRQRLNIPYPPKTISYYMKFYKSFVKQNVYRGTTVFGVGFISQDEPIGTRTIFRMIRQARLQTIQEQQNKRSDRKLSTAQAQ